MVDPPAGDARAFLSAAKFIWHQRFRLCEDVYTPGVNDVEWLASTAGLPQDLSGKTVLDVGTTNGGVAFEAERRGAARVLATDIVPATWFGFDELKAFLGASVEFRQMSVYELATIDEPFDVVIFWGVLYHLRHPLLALDNLRALTRELLLLETEIADGRLHRKVRDLPLARFYRGAELNEDPSNWFVPTVAALRDWCASAGFAVDHLATFPRSAPARCVISARPEEGDPEYVRISYERPLRTSVAGQLA